MHAARALASAHRPLIRFLGKRTLQAADSTPAPHPASPTGVLPNSFAKYRQTAQQHGPLSRHAGSIGSSTGASMGAVAPGSGVFFDRSELPARFRRMPFSVAEIEAVESGGASLF